MKLSIKGLAAASGLLWGGCMLACGLVNLASPAYGRRFLKLMSSIYPGFHDSRTVPDVLVGAGYGLVDGAIAGAMVAVLYNQFNGQGAASPANATRAEVASSEGPPALQAVVSE